MRKGLHLRFALFLALAGLLACQTSRSTNGSFSQGSSQIEGKFEIHRHDGPPRDLSQDEAAGGHVLRKHVGLTDEELRERLDREQHISGASTYTDRATAEQVIGNAIADNNDRIQRWLGRSGGHSNLVLDYDADGPVGRTLNRGDSQPRPCSHAVVVLKYDPPSSYHVLTSYPECRS